MVDEAIELLSRQLQREKLVKDAKARGDDATASDSTNLRHWRNKYREET